MANHPSDRQRMRDDLRELAKLASPGATTHGFDTADSSGYVDLSAYSTRDPGWVERELARAKKGAPPPLPRPGSRGIDALTPASMAPVALEAFVLPDDTAQLRPSRGKKALYGVLGLASAGIVAFLAVTLAKHPPPSDTKTQVAAAVLAPPVADPVPATTTAAASPPTVAPTTSATAPAVTPAAVTTAAATSVATAAPTSKKKTAPAARIHAAAATGSTSPAPARATAASRPAVIPQSKPSSGGDSLMDLIKKSVATGK
jgi:hypothetical protein